MTEKDVKNKAIATTILQQLGGGKFAIITGSKNFGYVDNGLTMKLAKNSSGANQLTITVTFMDDYIMEFKKVTVPHMRKDYTFTKGQNKVIRRIDGVFCDTLRETFEQVTGLYTHF